MAHGQTCNRTDCGTSTGICGRLTFGYGELDDYGYWEFPCSACAREWERLENERSANAAEPAWPLMTGREFLELCRRTEEITSFVANVGLALLQGRTSETFVLAGFAILARRDLLLYKDLDANPSIGRFVVVIDKILEDQGKTLTVFPGDLDDQRK